MSSGQQEISTADAERLVKSLSGAKAAGREVRDLKFPPGMGWKPGDVRGVAFGNVEWPGAAIKSGLWGRGRFQDCRFESVNLDSLRCRKIDFEDCQFESVTFGEHYFGNFNACTFRNCSFKKCRFDAVSFVQATLRSCRFEEVRGERAMWRECLIEDVVISGKLVKTNFVRTAFRRVDLSQAKLLDCSLVYTKEEDVTLPDRPDNFTIDAQLFLDAESHLSSKLEPTAFETYRRLAKSWSPFGSPFIVWPGAVDEMPPRERPVVLATLYEMRHHRPIWTQSPPAPH